MPSKNSTVTRSTNLSSIIVSVIPPKNRLLLVRKDSSGGSGEAPFEGVEICNFNLDGAHYMIYTPVDPLLFVAVKDKDGVLRIAEDDLMDDPSIVSAIDEETEFTALVEEEEALLESILHGDDDVS
uniref:Uncharacterized protein n=1 Tax=Aegilops tauschii TaxID=37682 RepID=R7WE01_AEGTA